jgi:hypothetical protein
VQGSAVNALAWDRSIIMAATDTDIQAELYLDIIPLRDFFPK